MRNALTISKLTFCDLFPSAVSSPVASIFSGGFVSFSGGFNPSSVTSIDVVAVPLQFSSSVNATITTRTRMEVRFGYYGYITTTIGLDSQPPLLFNPWINLTTFTFHLSLTPFSLTSFSLFSLPFHRTSNTFFIPTHLQGAPFIPVHLRWFFAVFCSPTSDFLVVELFPSRP
ncbi:hypothetical protein ACSQ67_003093 [Phaseolus vulgaris]